MSQVYPIDDNVVQVDGKGVLMSLVRQPCDGSPSEDSRGLHYKENWKSNYATLKEILSYIKVGDSIATVYATLATHFAELNKWYEPPQCPNRKGKSNKWIVESISIQEIKAGALALLTIEYSSALDEEDEDELSEDPYQDVWSLTW